MPRTIQPALRTALVALVCAATVRPADGSRAAVAPLPPGVKAVSALSPWEHGHFWKLREGVDKSRRELEVDWEDLQRPGLSPDYIDQRYERMDLAFERTDWIATPAAEALLRNNRPLLAYIAGKRGAFTSKDHNCRRDLRTRSDPATALPSSGAASRFLAYGVVAIAVAWLPC